MRVGGGVSSIGTAGRKVRGGMEAAFSGVSRREPMTAAEIAFVSERRSAGVSWQNCAAMVDRCVVDVRAKCDPTFPGFQGVAASAPAAPTAEPRKLGAIPPGRHLRPRTIAALVLVALKAAPLSARRVAKACGQNEQSVRSALYALEGMGLLAKRLRGDRPPIWWPTGAGLDEVAALEVEARCAQ